MSCILYKNPKVQELAKAIGESAPVAAAMISTVISRHEQNQSSFESDITGGSQREFTPDKVTSLQSNEVFVFGSNAKGVHGKGAALTAKTSFGAKQGQAEGLQGQSYAVITKADWRKEKSSTLQEIGKGLQDMLLFASKNTDKKFLVTKLGSSLAGYTEEEIKGLFEKLKNYIPDNVILPKEYEVRTENKLEKDTNEEYFPTIAEMLAYKEETAKERKLIYNTSLKAVSPLEQVFANIDPVTRKNRATLIASLFSDVVSMLEKKYPGMDRAKIIDTETPLAIFNKVKSGFELKLKYGKNLSDTQLISLQKTIDNFEALASLASGDLLLLEGLKFGYDTRNTKKADYSDENNDGSENDIIEDEFKKEEQVKEGWMVNYMHMSSHASLSQKVRKLLARIELLDVNGQMERDDLGYKRYLDPEVVHVTLLNKLKYMTDSKDLIPMLKKMALNKSWVNNIITALENDNSLLSSFYSDMRKDATLFSIQKAKPKDGGFTYETIEINNPEGYGYLIQVLKDNIQSTSILSNNSVYDIEGKINNKNVSANEKLVKELIDNYKSNIPVDGSLEVKNYYISKFVEDNILIIKDLILSTGLDVDTNNLKDALLFKTFSSNKQITFTPTLLTTLDNLQTMFNILSKSKPEINNETKEEKRVDFYKLLKSKYDAIANSISQVTEDNIESSVFENGKSYYSHLVPSYIAKQINNLKNVAEDEERFDAFIEDNYKKVDWFHDGTEFRSEWLKLLASKDSTGVEARKLLNRKVLINFNKINYSNLDDLDYTTALINEFFSDKNANSAWYHVPILSDAPVGEFIKFKRYTDKNIPDKVFGTYKNYLLDKFANLALQELSRMDIVNGRNLLIEKDERGNDIGKVLSIKNFDTRGKSFQFFPSLNDSLEEIQAFITNPESTGTEIKAMLSSKIEEMINSKFQNTLKDWNKIGLFDNTAPGKKDLKYLSLDGGRNKESAIPLLENYFWNSMFATSQIIQLTTTDIAYYGNIEDFQKRNKQIHAPAMRGNTEATWTSNKEVNGVMTEVTEQVGREWENTVTLRDNKIGSVVYDEIQAALEVKVKNGDITKWDADEMLSKYDYKQINEADAQAYRSLPSYRRVMVMFGKWTPAMESAYTRLMDGTWNMEDYNVVWSPFKPFMYTQKIVDSGVKYKEGHPKAGQPIYIKVPNQHKNSEFLLLPTKGIIANSPVLQGISDFMQDQDIDVVQFESAIKDGLQGAIDISDYNDRESVREVLNVAIKDPFTGSQRISKVPYADYGIQQEVPEHAVDDFAGFGTQIRKLVFSDMKDDEDVSVELASGKFLKRTGSDGKERNYTKKELHNLYKSLITANIVDSFKKVSNIFNDIEEVERVLQEEVKGSSRHGNDMLLAVTLVTINEKRDADGNITHPGEKVFNIPLFEPSQSQRVQTLINSIIKSRVTKQKIKGGSLVQVSKFGSPDLHIRFKNKDGLLLNTGEKSQEAHSIAYFECFMPWYTQKYFQEFMDENGELDINKRHPDGSYVIPEELRKLVGYRIPTEDKYSMVPLYIKGFLPRGSGGGIMLPSEITTISGSDFDVDKLYIMLPEFDLDKTYNIKAAWNEFYAQNEEIHEEVQKALLIDKSIITKLQENFINSEGVLNSTIEGVTTRFRGYELVEGTQKKFKEWFQGDTKIPFLQSSKIIKKQFDANKSVLKNGIAERNNLMIDIMFGILTNHNNLHKMLNPGGFDIQKKAARIVTLMKTMDFLEKDENGKFINGIYLEREAINKRITKESNKVSIYDVLNTKPLDILDKLYSIYKEDLDMLNPRTQVNLHQQNTTAGKLIGIYANHNANHAIMQDTQLELSEEGSFNFLYGGANKLTKLNQILSPQNTYISRNNAGFLAASVDAVKDPVLNFMNLNTFTADTSMLLSRLGYSPNEIGMLLSQPIILKMTQEYFREGKNGVSKEDIVSNIISLYSNKKTGDRLVTMKMLNDGILNSNFEVTITRDGIETLVAIDDLTRKEKDDYSNNHKNSNINDYYRDQTDIGFLFKKILASSQALADLTGATRADTSGGGAGPTIADTINKINKVKDFNEALQSEKSLLNNAYLVQEDMKFEVTPDILGSNGEILIKGETLEENMLKQFMNSPLPYIQSFYTLGVEKTGELLGNYFPHYKPEFQHVLNSIRETTKNKRLNEKTINNIFNDLFAYIINSNKFFGGSNLTNSLIDADDFINKFPNELEAFKENNPKLAILDFLDKLKIISDKDSGKSIIAFRNVGGLSTEQREEISNSWTTLLYSGKKGKDMAIKLFKYAYYRNGFAFGPNTFMHLAPVQIKQAIPKYIDSLRDIINIERPEKYYDKFVMQYLLNHTDNISLVPKINLDTTTYGKKFIIEKVAVDSIKIKLNEHSSSEDKMITISTEFTKKKGFSAVFKPVITVDNGKESEVYVLDYSSTTSDVASYVNRDRLGMKNNFIQYSFGVDSSELHNVITKGLTKSNLVAPALNYKEHKSGFVDNDNIDYDDDRNQIPGFEGMVIPEEISFKHHLDNFYPSQIEDADKVTTGINIKDALGIDNINNSKNYEDANGEAPCQ